MIYSDYDRPLTRKEKFFKGLKKICRALFCEHVYGYENYSYYRTSWGKLAFILVLILILIVIIKL